MRKIAILFAVLISVLNIWGQQDDIALAQELKAINDLKTKQAEVVEQAKRVTKIPEADRNAVDSMLTSVFGKIDMVMSACSRMPEDSELRSEALKAVSEFVQAYNIAILDDKKENVQILSRKFLGVVEKYDPMFDDFYKRVQEYIDSNSAQEPEKEDPEAPVAPVVNSLKAENAVEAQEVCEGNGYEKILLWISVALGLAGFIMGLIALLLANRAHARVNRRKEELMETERRLTQMINEIKPSGYRGPVAAVTSLPAQKPVQQRPPQRKPQTPVRPAKYTEPVQKANVENEPSTSSLFATVKAQSSFPEFFKVAKENSGDKVYMLILDRPDAEFAEFTIAPNMSPDFMKSIIVDRDTYLPPIFCQKSIESGNPTRIEVLSKGKAKKVDGKWLVQDRMVIRLV